MCDGCDAFVRERGGAIRAAAVLQTQSYRLSREEFDDLVYSAILRVIERKQTDPQIIERPNRYFHRIVENLSVDNYREARQTAKEFADRRGLSVEAAKKRRQRAVTIISKKLEGGF